MKIKHLTITALLTLIFILCACGQKKRNTAARSTEGIVQEKETKVKLVPVVFGGNRYVVNADFGLEENVPLMVHGNANLYLMITHDIAEKLNDGNPIEKIRDYGYSDRGMGRVDVGKFQIGNKTFSNVNNVAVFDWPEKEGKAAQGMIGIKFLEIENVKIDFVKEQMAIGVGLTEQPDQKLMDQGYVYTRFFIENGEGYMNVYFDDFNKEIPVTVGTVSDAYCLDVVMFRDAIEVEETDSKSHSPDATTPQIFTNADRIKYRIANQPFEIPCGKAELYSFAEYENISQSQLFPFGIFGRDWMKENNAIIDYANKILYFKTSDEAAGVTN
jgi:hypothetical protein